MKHLLSCVTLSAFLFLLAGCASAAVSPPEASLTGTPFALSTPELSPTGVATPNLTATVRATPKAGTTQSGSQPKTTNPKTNTNPAPQQSAQQPPSQAPAQQPSPPAPAPTKAPAPAPTKAAPAPTPTPAPDNAPSNPWGYNFQPGNQITAPPTTFCNYFKCITNFPNGKGYVMECKDAMYSLSGGKSGSCSGHSGNNRTLYSH